MYYYIILYYIIYDLLIDQVYYLFDATWFLISTDKSIFSIDFISPKLWCFFSWLNIDFILFKLWPLLNCKFKFFYIFLHTFTPRSCNICSCNCNISWLILLFISSLFSKLSHFPPDISTLFLYYYTVFYYSSRNIGSFYLQPFRLYFLKKSFLKSWLLNFKIIPFFSVRYVVHIIPFL